MLLVDALPELAAEIGELLDKAGESQVLAQLGSLSIVDRCRCGDDFCASFYTAQKPFSRYGGPARCLALEPRTGEIVLDVVGETVVHVEVLFRDEIRKKLHQLLQ